MESAVPMGVVMLAVVAASISDVRKFKVYNALTFPMVACGLLYHYFVGGASALSTSFFGALFAFLVLLLPYALGAMGAGDVKLAAGIGAWLGAELMIPILAIGLLATAVYSLVALLMAGRLRESWVSLQVAALQVIAMSRHLMAVENQESVQEMVKRPEMRSRLIPFSVMLAIGVVVTAVGRFMGFTFW